MVLNLLSDTLPWGDRLNFMGVGVLLGMVVIFAVLGLLWIILEISGKIASGGKPASKAAPAPAPVFAPAPVPAPAAPVQTDDEAVVAAITAALAVYLEAEGAKTSSVNGFRVVSFKKVGNAAHWNQN